MFHGTCVDFDYFWPLSHFALDKRICKSRDFSTKKRFCKTEVFRSQEEDQAILSKTIDKMIYAFEHPKLHTKEIRQDFKVIPAYLKIKNPLPLTVERFWFDQNTNGLIWSVLMYKGLKSWKQSLESDADSDFIIKDPVICPAEQVKHELGLGHLFPISENIQENRFRLAMQRFIFFMERHGFDGIAYHYSKSILANRNPGINMDNFDDRCYVILRPSQVVRLDKPELPIAKDESTVSEKIALNKIRYQHLQKYHSKKIDNQEYVNRVVYATSLEK